MSDIRDIGSFSVDGFYRCFDNNTADVSIHNLPIALTVGGGSTLDMYM